MRKQDDDDKDDTILKDGQTRRIPLMMMDGVQKSLHEHFGSTASTALAHTCTTAAAPPGSVGSRPGWSLAVFLQQGWNDHQDVYGFWKPQTGSTRFNPLIVHAGSKKRDPWTVPMF